MAQISVAEAAGRLGVNVQRVHQRIADGSLPAERIGHQWTIDEADVARLAGRPTGRPLSARSAWVLALVAAEHLAPEPLTTPYVAAPERSRARARLRHLLDDAHDLSIMSDQESAASQLAARLRSLLRRRTDRRLFHVSSRDLADLRSDDRVALSGVSLPESGISAEDIVEGYTARDDVKPLVDDYLLLDSDHRSANVVLHVVDPTTMPSQAVGPSNWLLMAADLAEYHRPRETARAVQILREACVRQRAEPDAQVGR